MSYGENEEIVDNFFVVLDKIQVTKIPDDTGPGAEFGKRPFLKLVKILNREENEEL